MGHTRKLQNKTKIKELYRLYSATPEEHILTAKRQVDKSVLLYIFSDNMRNGNGQRLADYIKTHKLGDIEETQEIINPNSGNKIKTWVWAVDKKNLKEHKIT